MPMSDMNRCNMLQHALLLVRAAALPSGAEALAAVAKFSKHQLHAARYKCLLP